METVLSDHGWHCDQLDGRDRRPLIAVPLLAFALAACGGGGNISGLVIGVNTGTGSVSPAAVTPSGTEYGINRSGDTSGVACNYNYNAFNNSASVNLSSMSTWTCGVARVLMANGIPDHATGVFPNAGNPNAIAATTVAASYSLSPTYNGTAIMIGGPAGVTGHVLNGVKIDAGTAGSCVANASSTSNCSLINNTGAWNIEALGQTTFNFGKDSNNAHVQPNGQYHYHGLPEGFLTLKGAGPSKMTLIGWAADGFPIYARYGHSIASRDDSALKVIKGSYALTGTVVASRPAPSLIPLGTFAQDWEYVAGSGDLDECNGRVGVTPEFPGGIYHYYATDNYPYFQRCIKGNR